MFLKNLAKRNRYRSLCVNFSYILQCLYAEKSLCVLDYYTVCLFYCTGDIKSSETLTVSNDSGAYGPVEGVTAENGATVPINEDLFDPDELDDLDDDLDDLNLNDQ